MLNAITDIFVFSLQLPSLLHIPTVQEIAKKHNKTPAQVLLRHLIQKGIATIPKSTNPQRLQENFNVFDFELDSGEIERLNGLDKGEEGRIFNFTSFFKG